jgi:hypothetical protein
MKAILLHFTYTLFLRVFADTDLQIAGTAVSILNPAAGQGFDK